MEEKINLIIKKFDCIKALPGEEKEILSKWNKEDLEKLISHIPYTEFLSILLKNK